MKKGGNGLSKPCPSDRLRRGDEKPDADGYEVGYGKPPKHTQFQKGQSGNPRGRPKKTKERPIRLSDAVSDEFLQEEAYRCVTLRENGQAIELPVSQAVMRSLATSAIKGNRFSQKYFLEWLARTEDEHYQAKLDRYIRLKEVKQEGERRLEVARCKGLPLPDLLPHPDDIVLNPTTGDAYINGPETREDLEFTQHSIEFRNFLTLCSVDAETRGKTMHFIYQGASICSFLLLAQWVNHFLPNRFRWTDQEAFELMMEYRSMSKRARERQVDIEAARFQTNWKPPRGMTPEQAEIIERARKRFLNSAA